MSFLRALRAYIGLGPDEDIEGRYLYELNSRRRELDLDELHEEEQNQAEGGARRSRAGSDSRSRADNIFEAGFRDQDLGDADFEFGSDHGGHDEFADGFDTNEFLHDADGFNTDEFVDPDEPVVVTPARIAANRSHGRRRRQPDAEQDRRSDSARTSSRRGPSPDIDLVDGPFDDVTAEFLSGTSPFADVDLGNVDPVAGAGTLPAAGLRQGSEPAERDGGDGGEGKTMRRGHNARQQGRSEAKAKRGSRPGTDESDEAVVRSLDSMRAKPKTIIPESFADAKLVADEFKRDIPVLLNLQGLDRDLARRLIDFASGICYALDGSMEKTASQVFLLIPDGAEVSDEDRRRIEERGYAR